MVLVSKNKNLGSRIEYCILSPKWEVRGSILQAFFKNRYFLGTKAQRSKCNLHIYIDSFSCVFNYLKPKLTEFSPHSLSPTPSIGNR